VKHWHRLLRDRMDVLSLETVKVRLDGALSTCSTCRSLCLLQGSWTRWPLSVPSNWNDSTILRFYDSSEGPESTGPAWVLRQSLVLGTAPAKNASECIRYPGWSVLWRFGCSFQPDGAGEGLICEWLSPPLTGVGSPTGVWWTFSVREYSPLGPNIFRENSVVRSVMLK